MSDIAMTRCLADTPTGGVVAVQARHLWLGNEELDSDVKGWLAVGGGPGFIAIRGSRETRSDDRQYNTIAVQRTSWKCTPPRSASQARRRAGVVIV
jgi:hypothetical protein